MNPKIISVLFSILFLATSYGYEINKLPDDTYSEVIENSPFTRAINQTQKLALTGIAQFDGEVFVTILDRDTNQSRFIGSREADKDGYMVLGIEEEGEDGLAVARLSVNGQPITVNFDEELSKPKAAKRPAPTPQVQNQQGNNGTPQANQNRRKRSKTPKHITNMYRSMSREQRQQFVKWRAEYYKNNKDRQYSDERFPAMEQAMTAIQNGGTPPQ